MVEYLFSFPDVPRFAEAMRTAAPEHLTRQVGRAMFKIGKSDIAKMKSSGLSGLNIKANRFKNSFKFFATDSRTAKSINDLQLSEYTGAKPFKIFQEGGDISPAHAKTLTILTDAARTAGGKRKYSPQELRALVDSGQAAIIQTKAGPALIQNIKYTKGGRPSKGFKPVVLAFLKTSVHEDKRLDFFANYDANDAVHEQILNDAAEAAINATIADEEADNE